MLLGVEPGSEDQKHYVGFFKAINNASPLEVTRLRATKRLAAGKRISCQRGVFESLSIRLKKVNRAMLVNISLTGDFKILE